MWCFANESHASLIIKEILKNSDCKAFSKVINTSFDNQERFKKFFTIQKQTEFRIYMKDCNEALLNSSIRLHSLHAKRGITEITAKAVKLGIDKNKHRWVIPTFQYSTKKSNVILGFEYRPLNFSKDGLTREKGAPTGLAMINSYTPKTEALAIVEGYFDSYALWQYLKECGYVQYYHIVTPSNGINSLLKHMPQVDFGKYKKYYLYLDNDEAGQAMSKKILEKYPMFEPITMNCGCKDFNEHYIKCIKQAKKSYPATKH